ncbi:dynein axonemal intermediate chain 3 [Cololabis saira]|uniref:dynein axonemal intermediate chain 3 n=1 Tax=Cololabis saira TaxID=129043 RepID=UPI002AD2FBD8|nr:dynein axonemal intermediate chain 3 [Cololabis saira]
MLNSTAPSQQLRHISLPARLLKPDGGKKSRSPTPKKSSGHPDDILPLVLTSATQELFGCRADEDVTPESPYKLLQKEDIMKDIKTRAAVSDFSPVKKTVQDYPEEEILLVFDTNFTYGQSFYLAVTPTAKSRILTPPEPVFENTDQKTPEPKHWISLGSEKEIDEESVKETRKKLKFRVQLQGRMGEPACFCDYYTAHAVAGLQDGPGPRDRRTLGKRDGWIQAGPWTQSCSSQTDWKSERNVFTQASPTEFCQDDAESSLRSESLTNLLQLGMVDALQQDESTDGFVDEWERDLANDCEADDWSEKTELVLHKSFTDDKYTKGKKISSLNWHPTIPDVMAVALIEKGQKPSVSSPSFIVFFCFSSAEPQLVLQCPDDVFAFEFCPSNPNIIAGGCRNGQIVLWDISGHISCLQETEPGSEMISANTDTFDLSSAENKPPVVFFSATSSLVGGHKAPVTDVRWLPPSFQVTRTGVPTENELGISVQLASCSPDRTIKFWDVRAPESPSNIPAVNQKNPMSCSVPETFKHLDGTWRPFFQVSPPKIDTREEYAPLKFSLDPGTGDGSSEKENLPDYSQLTVRSTRTIKTLEDVNTKLFIGTQDGEIVYADWKLEKIDSTRFRCAKPLYSVRAHPWLVNSVQRSPFFNNIILTTGGWNFAIWKEGVESGPLVLSQIFEHECTAGCWSPSRPAVFFIGTEEGSIEVWNLLEKSKVPTVHSRISAGSITCIKSSTKGVLALTDDLGVTWVLKLPKPLYRPSKHEIRDVKEYFELEESWLENCLRREELWETEKKNVKEPEKEKQTAATPVQAQQDQEQLELKQFHEDLMLEQNVLKALGLSAPS